MHRTLRHDTLFGILAPSRVGSYMHLPGRSQSSQVSAPLNARNILMQLLRTCCSLSVTQRYTLILLCYGHSEHVTHKYFIWNTLCPTVCYVFQGFRLCCPAIVWVILGVSTRWKSMCGKRSINNQKKNVHRLLPIDIETSNRRHTRYLKFRSSLLNAKICLREKKSGKRLYW